MLFQFKTQEGKFAITSYRRVKVSPVEYHIFLTSPNTNLDAYTICCDETTSKVVLKILDQLSPNNVITEEELMNKVKTYLDEFNVLVALDFMRQYGCL